MNLWKTSCILTASAALLLSGCSKASVVPDNQVLLDQLLTMDALSDNKTTITIRAEYNVNNENIRKALQEKFPDTNIVMVFHCSEQTQYELRQSLLGGTGEDIIISPNMKPISDIASDSLMDLSSESYVDNYKGSSLSDSTVDGKIYYLPGPSSIYGIVYDKTLFAENGWSVPHSYDEFVELVKTIGATGIRAFQPTCKYARQAQMVFTMFNYAETFSGTENYNWLVDYQNGDASMSRHIENALTRYQSLNQADIIQPEDFDVQPGNRSKMIYNDHTAAMIIETENAAHYAEQAGSDHEYGMFPFYSGNTEADQYVMSAPSYYIGLNKDLNDTKNTKKLAVAKQIMNYISTPEGQLALSGGTMTQISNVEGTEEPDSPLLENVLPTIRMGHAVPEVDLMASGNNNAAETALVKDLRKYLEGTEDAVTLMQDCDQARTKALAAGIDKGTEEGTASATFSRIQTGLFIADVLKEKASADIGLCLGGTIRDGMVGQIYQGTIYTKDISSLSLSVGTVGKDPNDKKLWLVEYTGEQLKALLETATKLVINDNVPNLPYYTASGLKIEFAPTREDKIASVTMADGSDVINDKTYTVALWGWPFEESCQGKVLQVYDDSINTILTDAIHEKSTISPFTDDRFKVLTN